MRTLSVTISDELYDSLRHTVPSRQVSKFVSEIIAESLAKKRESLYQAYLAASEDKDREAEINNWDVIDVESWTKDEDNKTS